jgi:hypothetical protein
MPLIAQLTEFYQGMALLLAREGGSNNQNHSNCGTLLIQRTLSGHRASSRSPGNGLCDILDIKDLSFCGINVEIFFVTVISDS